MVPTYNWRKKCVSLHRTWVSKRTVESFCVDGDAKKHPTFMLKGLAWIRYSLSKNVSWTADAAIQFFLQLNNHSLYSSPIAFLCDRYISKNAVVSSLTIAWKITMAVKLSLLFFVGLFFNHNPKKHDSTVRLLTHVCFQLYIATMFNSLQTDFNNR